MARTAIFDALIRMRHTADSIDTAAGRVGPVAPDRGIRRREFLSTTGRVAAAAIAAAVPGRSLAASAALPDVGIVGGGLAGLACADALRQKRSP
jgi:hypothetical protein